ncbi:hypothetical protein EXU57_07220 [Segetibacter sp. 3557_3]|uniref:hypothetical protein n=1 Tax=Segetibacter sp. 3557_3 TaxID=2547429 RepID=UPI001058E867|nr:hypothetical protein [Segetibacter sp. 3557_3]TDH27370.1 hypothetical protein EXU57_07220 [Segetibacter sp. 3557_3]
MSALLGWLIMAAFCYLLFRKPSGFPGQLSLEKVLLARKDQIITLVESGLIKQLEEGSLKNIVNPDAAYQQLNPMIEQHIDVFLRHKLKQEIPMIGSLIGDRTISQLKTVFMKQLEELFPQVMETYFEKAITKTELQPILERTVGRAIHYTIIAGPTFFKGELRSLQWLGAVFGFIIGLLQLLLILVML